MSLTFGILFTLCLGVGLLGSSFLGLCFLNLYVCFLHQIRKVFCNYFSNRFSISCSLSPPSGPVMRMLEWSQRLLTLSSFFGFFFQFAVLIRCSLLLYLPNCWFSSLLHLNYSWFPLMYFSFQLLYSLFLTGFFMFYISVFMFAIPLLKFSVNSSTLPSVYWVSL